MFSGCMPAYCSKVYNMQLCDLVYITKCLFICYEDIHLTIVSIVMKYNFNNTRVKIIKVILYVAHYLLRMDYLFDIRFLVKVQFRHRRAVILR